MFWDPDFSEYKKKTIYDQFFDDVVDERIENIDITKEIEKNNRPPTIQISEILNTIEPLSEKKEISTSNLQKNEDQEISKSSDLVELKELILEQSKNLNIIKDHFYNKSFECYFISPNFIGKNNITTLSNYFIEFKFDILSKYNEKPIFYPFGDIEIDNLPRMILPGDIDMIFETFNKKKGVVEGQLVIEKNKYTIVLETNYKSIIYSFPCVIKFAHRTY